MIKMNEEVKITCDNDVMKYSPDQIYDYIYELQNNWNELKKWLEKQSKFIKDIPVFTSDIANNHAGMIGAYDTTLEKMQEMEQGKDE